jgi:NAD(P)-dependent dehydrogenase (short-subunit alcohol dehydrogenase family)
MMQRTILITGCSTGIGRCAALGMKACGWDVFATARKPEDIASLKAEGIPTFYLDYTEEESIAAALDATLFETGGRLDALFNNGAYAQPGALEDLPLSALRAQFDANFFGWHALTQRVVPVMRRQGSGRIVMNSSILGFMALGFRGAYICTKFAVEAYADTLRIELEGTGIHVSVIEPGPVRSNISKTAALHFRRNIAIERSIHAAYYKRRLASLERGGNSFGELGPEAVLNKLVHACESRNPRPVYFVTTPTRTMSILKRIMPKRQFHALLTRATRRT